MEKKTVKIKARRAVLHPEKPPRIFNKLLWTRVGPEAVLDIGYYDLAEMRDALDKAKASPSTETEVTVYVTERLTITPISILDLLRVSSQLAREFVSEKMLDADDVRKAQTDDQDVDGV